MHLRMQEMQSNGKFVIIETRVSTIAINVSQFNNSNENPGYQDLHTLT